MASPYLEGAKYIFALGLPQFLGFEPDYGARTGGPDPSFVGIRPPPDDTKPCTRACLGEGVKRHGRETGNRVSYPNIRPAAKANPTLAGTAGWSRPGYCTGNRLSACYGSGAQDVLIPSAP